MSRAARTPGPEIWHALVLAGSRGENDPVAAAAGVTMKAFAPVADRPMIERVVAALQDSGRIAQVTVALPAEAPAASEAPGLAAAFDDGRVRRVEPAGTPSASVLAALASVPEGAGLLVTTADHALLTPEMVDLFLAGAGATGAHAAIGVTRFAALQAAHPRAVRTRLAFRDGSYSGCNLFAFVGSGARAAVAFWQGLEAHRKSPPRLAARIGLVSLLGYVFRRWTLEQAVGRLGARVGARAAPVELPQPDAAIDVDTPGDLDLARRIVAARAAAR